MLVIIESPNKASHYREILKCKVIATVGHFKDLPGNELGVDVANGFEPHFVVNEGKKDVIKKLKEQAKGEDVLIATDPDREGFAIGRMAYEEIKGIAKSIRRAEVREITHKGIHAAVDAAVPYAQANHGMYDSFLGRRVADRLSGYLLSPLACKNLNGKFSVGRVQSPALRLVVEKEREIRAFKPSVYFEIYIDCFAGGKTFKMWYAPTDEKRLDDKASAEAIRGAVTAAVHASITKAEKKPAKRNPPPPFTTVDLQAVASSQLGLSPENTMKLAQSLFEAGHISYHRTDSTSLCDEIITDVRAVIGGMGARYLPPTPVKHKNDKSQAQVSAAP